MKFFSEEEYVGCSSGILLLHSFQASLRNHKQLNKGLDNKWVVGKELDESSR